MKALALAFGSGVVGLALQMVWLRAVDLATGSHPVVFGVVIGTQLLGLALGAAWAGADLRARPAHVERHLAWRFGAGGVLAAVIVPALAWAQPHTVAWIAPAVLLVAATVCLGGTLPLVSALATSSVSRVYLANVLGAALAPLVTTYVAFDRIGLDRTSLLTCVVCVALGAWCGRRALVAVVVLVLIAVLIPARSTDALILGRRGGGQFAEVVENRASVIGVTADKRVYGGGAYDGGINVSLATADDINGITRAYLADLLAPNAQQVLQIGASTGAWAQVLANAPPLERLTLIEINPGYRAVIARHPEVASLADNPKVEWVDADGRLWLQQHPAARFDLIVMNTTFHWRAQATNLLSREFMRLLKAHLTPSGVIYLNTTGSRAVTHTVANEFAYVATYANFVAAKMQPFVLDRDAFMDRAEHWSIDGTPVFAPGDARAVLRQAADALLVTDRETLLTRLAREPLITDDNMAEEFRLFRLHGWK